MKKGNKRLLSSVLVFALLLFAAGRGASAYAAELPEKLVPIGRTAGIKLFADGVVVLATGEVETPAGALSPAESGGLMPGDVILYVNGERVTENEMLSSSLEGRAGQKTEFKIRRGDGEKTLWVTPAEDLKGDCCIGASVRDSIAGIGTITYYNPEDGTFGALGHGICQSESGELFPLGSGCLVPSEVVGVNKGAAGKPGELLGAFDSDGDCGEIRANTERGIFGSLEADGLYPENLNGEALSLGDKAEKGKAYVLSNVFGGNVAKYEIEIVKTANVDRLTKNFQFRVSDAVLLEATGGVVQGMSGSPIIQNGKLIGAVTHVSVNDPTVGYGILIENMLSAAA